MQEKGEKFSFGYVSKAADKRRGSGECFGTPTGGQRERGNRGLLISDQEAVNQNRI